MEQLDTSSAYVVNGGIWKEDDSFLDIRSRECGVVIRALFEHRIDGVFLGEALMVSLLYLCNHEFYKTLGVCSVYYELEMHCGGHNHHIRYLILTAVTGDKISVCIGDRSLYGYVMFFSAANDNAVRHVLSTHTLKCVVNVVNDVCELVDGYRDIQKDRHQFIERVVTEIADYTASEGRCDRGIDWTPKYPSGDLEEELYKDICSVYGISAPMLRMIPGTETSTSKFIFTNNVTNVTTVFSFADMTCIHYTRSFVESFTKLILRVMIVMNSDISNEITACFRLPYGWLHGDTFRDMWHIIDTLGKYDVVDVEIKQHHVGTNEKILTFVVKNTKTGVVWKCVLDSEGSELRLARLECVASMSSMSSEK